MIKLSVNVNKLATIRNARGKNNPDVLLWSKQIESFGADGITVHPRPDERHIRFSDVQALSKVVRGEFNIEGYPEEAWLGLVAAAAPDQATLVPDPPEAITSNAGFDVVQASSLLRSAMLKIPKKTRVSVFIDPIHFSKSDAELLKSIGVSRIELYTEAFAENFMKSTADDVIESYVRAATWARDSGLGVNAGHDLNLENLPVLVRHIPWMEEVSIGHALICDALKYGMESTVAKYIEALRV